MAPPTAPLPGDFAALAARWRAETAHLSDLGRAYRHPAYRAILALGPAAVPPILRELAARGGWWFDALRELTGEDPLPPGVTLPDAGVTRLAYPALRDAWLAWGVARGHLPPPRGADPPRPPDGRPGRLAERLLDRLARRRFDIRRPGAAVPPLTRWVLLGTGAGWAVYVHRFRGSDDASFHDHPWPFLSVILAGGYWEEAPAGQRTAPGTPVVRRWYGPGRVLARAARWVHRVAVPAGRDAWTLVVHRPPQRAWRHWCPATGFLPWAAVQASKLSTGAGCPGPDPAGDGPG